MRDQNAMRLDESPDAIDGHDRLGLLVPLTGHRRRRAFRRRLRSMTRGQRIESAAEGRFTRAERCLWASLYPEEVPLINGELEWITLGLADLD